MKKRLKFLDRFLTIWIFAAMAIGIGLGHTFPFISDSISDLSSGTTNIPLAVGLVLMMYPPLVKIDFKKLPAVLAKPKLLTFSLFITWIVGPLLMCLLAILFLSNEPDYLSGLIIIGIAPCIAMVIVWSDLAEGNRELTAGLIGINSILQITFFSLYAYFYLEIVLPLFGINGLHVEVTISQIAETVGIYLGIPFAAALLSRSIVMRTKGENWLQTRFIPYISPVTLIALLATIIVMFCLKGQIIVSLPMDVIKVGIPLVCYFGIMFSIMFFAAKKLGADYRDNAALSFTAAGNNFELAIAVSIGVFGINSGQAFAGVIGPLVEVPALIILVRVINFWKNKYYH